MLTEAANNPRIPGQDHVGADQGPRGMEDKYWSPGSQLLTTSHTLTLTHPRRLHHLMQFNTTSVINARKPTSTCKLECVGILWNPFSFRIESALSYLTDAFCAMHDLSSISVVIE